MMTPKEKAEQIYNDFDTIIYTDQDHYHQVKQCSITAVNYIINAIANDQPDDAEHQEMYENFWSQVKTELEAKR